MSRLLLVLICLLALVVGGCGSDEGGGGEDDPLAALDAAARKTTAAESNRQQFKLEAEGGGQQLSVTGEGTMSADSTRGRMTFEIESDQLDGSFEAITVDGVMYMKGDQIPLPEGKEWLKTQDPPTSTMSPSEFVQFLRDSGKVENKGTEEIRGEQTVHYSGPLDIQKLAEESGSEIVERLRRTPNIENMEMLIDIWVGPDGLPARIALDVSAPEEGEGSMKITSDILEYNVDVEAEGPPASKVAVAGG
jgi:hypothetical protein